MNSTSAAKCRTMTAIFVAVVAAGIHCVASAATVYWKDNAPNDDWTDGSNYVGGAAPSAKRGSNPARRSAARGMEKGPSSEGEQSSS